MSKKTNTLLFIVGGTVFNILVTVLCFFLFLFVYSRFLFPHLPAGSAAWMIPVNFVMSIAASFLIYRQVVKLIMKKVDMEKYFDPVFTRSRPPRES
ncbi:MAG: leader peptide processing enzyme [Treponema sp.]|nr:leader peptide processing enzyme [Treponema sp.]